MAAKSRKRKTSKKKTKTVLKYELYGIGMLIFSAIALFRAGSVGRSLTILFRFLIGVLDWVIPLMVIYVAFFVMINRAWPRKWTPKKTGLLLLLIGFVLLMEMAMMRKLVVHPGDVTPSFIWNETWNILSEGIRLYPSESDILVRQVGGGVLGAALYATLDYLFSYEGTVIVVIALFAVGIMLVTGISFVEVGRQIRAFFRSVNKGIRRKIGFPKRKKSSSGTVKKKPAFLHGSIPDDAFDEDEEEEDASHGAVLPVLKKEKGNRKGRTIVDVTPLAPAEESAFTDEIPTGDERAEETPFIRDFLDHVEPSLDETDMPSGMPFVGNEPAVQSAPPQGAQSPAADSAAGVDAGEVVLNLQQVPPPKPYQMPGMNLLTRPAAAGKGSELSDYKANARKLEATLESFGVRAKVLEVVRGPAVTRYEVQPDVGVKVSRIVSLTDDIALALAAKDIRMEAPIPGKSAIGIEVPNSEVSIVTLREVMETSLFQDATAKLTVVLGRDISGQPIVGNLAKMPHVLVAGATGSGKSVCINGIITSILYKAKPDEVKFLMVDPKMVELNVYNGIPHLLAPVVTDPRRASLALKKIVVEMEKRYELFSKTGTRNIEGYNSHVTDPNNPNPEAPLPLIVVIVDELADLMMVAAGDVEDAICRLAQMARAAGIHLIIATQRPSVDVITGVIKANIPSRVAFGVSSQVDSRTILDMAGAEKLLGRGDMLYLPVGASKPVRVQGAFLSDQEVESVVGFVSHQEKAQYQEDLVPQLDETPEQEDLFADELYDQAVQIVVEAKQASVSLLQRRMRVGYTRAARLIDAMEAKGVVGPYEGSKPREVLVSIEQFQQTRISS
ncbi:FtsK/SpoIIIE family DNA translocase [Gorillibacterium timonense]|uniref:FtsK/SpoIIIE family DNA translocase n=1 Tax=Gorillibacterium timonense TaxID=1689269 RepID=UPI00071CBCA1|nr:DNA translocase FtsK [Gorillibacterium timonense]